MSNRVIVNGGSEFELGLVFNSDFIRVKGRPRT